MPSAPPMTPSEPAKPLWKLRGRGLSAAANSAGSAIHPWEVFWGAMPSAETVTSPQWSGPSRVSSPGLMPMKVMVCVARTAQPRTWPVSAFRPLGTSSARTGQDCAFT
jgi:hypothetical protein